MPIKNRQQLLVILAISAVALFAGDKLLLSPLLKSWDTRAKRVADLREKVQQGNRLTLRQTGIRKQWADMARRSLTNNMSAAEQQLFKAVDQWARDTGVTINAITPQWKRDSEDYITYDCRVDAAGDLSRLSQFLHRAEREPMALRFEAVELAARAAISRICCLRLA